MSEAPTQIVAIGDVHGAADLLATMLAALDRTAPDWPIYFLGDIVDRGPDSRGAMDLVVAALAARPGSKLLIGNHDDWLLRFLEDRLSPQEALHWLAQGGGETLRSYGVEPGADLAESRHRVLETRPAHLDLLADASVIETTGGFAFVHAGVDPARPFDRQDRHDCLWIRDPFLDHVGRLDHVVVHGHSPLKDGYPVVTENRISIDTAAVLNGALTAVLLDLAADTVRFVRTGQQPGVAPVAARRLDRGLGTVLDGSARGEA